MKRDMQHACIVKSFKGAEGWTYQRSHEINNAVVNQTFCEKRKIVKLTKRFNVARVHDSVTQKTFQARLCHLDFLIHEQIHSDTKLNLRQPKSHAYFEENDDTFRGILTKKNKIWKNYLSINTIL